MTPERRTLPKLKGHIGARAEAKAKRLKLSRKAVAKFLGCDPSALPALYRGYYNNHADADGNPPAKSAPLSDKMAAAVKLFLSKGADPKLMKLAKKYPQRVTK